MSRLKASATVQLDTNRQYGCLAGFRTHDTARERDDSSQQLSAVAQSVLPVFLSLNLMLRAGNSVTFRWSVAHRLPRLPTGSSTTPSARPR